MKNRNWFLLSLLLLMAAALLLRQGEQRRLREQIHGPAAPAAAHRTDAGDRETRRAPAPPPARVAPEPATAHLTSLGDDRQFPFRVSNSRQAAAGLFRSETAVLLRNALVETREPVRLNIPAHLRAQGDPGSYVVQARGTIDDRFRAVLRGVGAELVSYVPNNAFLVRASANDARQLRLSPQVRSVLPFEPFYKLDHQLLPLAVRREAMPAGRWLNVVLFNGAQEQGLAGLRALGADVKGEQRFPFGHVVTIAPPADSLVALAQMPAVQNIEAYQRPVLLNDLSRVRLDVSTNTTDPIAIAGANWLNLRGNNVTVSIVGSGVDTGHPQLAGRTFVNAASPTADTNGHETFMAGVIAALDSTTPAATNGSIAGGTYRGIAPGALVYPLSLYDGGFTNLGHEFLITNAAAVPGIAIVNNSWGYLNPAYDLYAAIYDEATRDSDPARTNDQPLTYVFAAGNIGGGNSGGLGGAADTIVSPATAKNVITVGATEQFRMLLNTNDPLSIARTDSDSQVLDTSSRGNVGVGLESTSGRFKPDLVAHGSYDVSLRSATFTTPTDADNQLGSSSFRYESGTSVAAAKVSGLLALMQEFFAVNYSRTNKPSFNKALLINRARSASLAYDLAVNNLVSHQGWGMPSLSNTLPTTTAFTFITNTGPVGVTALIVGIEESSYITNRLASGQYHEFNVRVPGSAASQTNTLRLTLAWTDPPGNPIASTKLVNDLDLFVTNRIANGNVYEGNNIAPGTTVSQPTPPGSESMRDAVNNVENAFITLTNTAATDFRVYVIGRKVNVNAVTAETNNVVQDYALVVSTDDPLRSVTVTRVLTGASFAPYTNRPVNSVTNGIPYLNEKVGANSPLRAIDLLGSVNTNGVTNQWNFYVFTNQNLPSTLTNFVTNIVAGVTNVSTNVVRPPITNGGPYVTFATFLPPNLARARNADADIDLFMTRSSLAYPSVSGAGGITNLEHLVLSDPNTMRSTNRGGYELISLDDSFIGEVFYVGIKSEDQQGGSYGFFAAATQQPFQTNGSNGGINIAFFPAPMDIADGAPEAPQGVTLYGISTTNVLMRSLIMSNVISHENLGDLVVTLTHNGRSVTLNNHTISPGAAPVGGGLVTHNLVADDFRNPPDGPGDVTDFLGDDSVGLWILEIFDNAPFETGTVDYAELYVMPFTNYVNTNVGVYYRTVTLQAGQSFVDFLDVPVYATNLDIDVIGGLPPGPVAPGQGVEIYAANGIVPAAGGGGGVASVVDLDSLDTIPHLRISPTTTPPLTAGRWNTRVVNNSSGTITITNRLTLSFDLSIADVNFYRTNAAVDLLDDYTTNLFLTVPDQRTIAGVEVGMSILHPRISDLRVTLHSPNGSKALLLENRGGTNGLQTADFRGFFTENTNFTTSLDVDGAGSLPFLHLNYLLPVKFVPAPYAAVISPPRLMTNMTNTTFGLGTAPPGFGPAESPGGLSILGKQLVMGGKVARNGTNDAFVAGWFLDGTSAAVTNKFSDGTTVTLQTPGHSFLAGEAVTVSLVDAALDGTYTISGPPNAPTATAFSYKKTGPAVGSQVVSPDGRAVLSIHRLWAATNYWVGSPGAFRSSDETFINGVAMTPQGVMAVGQTRNPVSPATNTWNGGSAPQTNDFDLGCTAGNLLFSFGSDVTVPDRVLVQYQGLTLLDVTSFAPYSTVIPFNGSSRFLRVVVNPTAAAGGSTWTNTMTIVREGGLSYAVSDFVAGSLVWPASTAPVAPLTLAAPRGVALDSTGNVYVADSGNDRIIRFSPSVTISGINTNATVSPLSVATPIITTGLNDPGGVAVDPSNGDIYVADTGNNQVKRYDTNGTLLFTWGDAAQTAGNEDSGVGGFANGRLNGPHSIAISNSAVLVADTGNSLIRTISGGTMTTLVTPVAVAPLNSPRALTVIGTNVYIADTANHRVVSFSGLGAVLAGSGVAGSADGFGAAATFSSPSGITAESSGNLYVADAGTHLIRRVTSLGQVLTIAGSSGVSGNANGNVGSVARFNTPRGLAADQYGAVYIAEDSANNRVRLLSAYQTQPGTPASVLNRPTDAFAMLLPFTGVPTNVQPVGSSAITVSRGVVSSAFGTDLSGAGTDERETLTGVTAGAENGTNFFYAVGSAQFSTNTVGGVSNLNRLFATKFDTNGQPIWTRAIHAPATVHAVLGVAGDITGLVLDSGGDGYSSTPVASVHDSVTGTTAPITMPAPVGGVIPSAPAFTHPGPFVAPRVYVEAPITTDMPGNAIAVAYGTNVILAGYTNTSAVPLTTNNLPLLVSLNPTNGAVIWTRTSPNNGHYNSIAVSGANIIAVGATYAPGVAGVASSNCLIERWTLDGTFLGSVTHTFMPASGASALSGVVAVDALDRAYAVGTVSNNAASVNAVMLELDLVTLAVLSVVTNDLNAGINVGKAIASDGGELYVATEGPADLNPTDRQAGLFRYRAKNYYLAEESLDVFIGESTWGTGPLADQWRLQITDTRLGGPVGVAQVVSWNLNFSYANSNTVSLPVPANLNNTFVLLAQPNYFQVSAPSTATAVTNYINAGAPVKVTFNALGAPVPGAAGNQVVFTGSSGSFVLSTLTGAARLTPGRKYYLAIEPLNGAAGVSLDLLVNFAEAEPVLPLLTSGAGLDGFIPRTPTLSHYRFEVPGSASATLFELLNLTGNLNLYVRRSNGVGSLPTPTTFDYLSGNSGLAAKQIFIVTNGASSSALTPGTWFVSVENADNAPVSFTLKATAVTGLPYQLVTAADGQPLASVTSPGNAPNTLFRFPVTGTPKALLFEVHSLTGPGDLVVRRFTYPLATTYDAANFRAGQAGEIVALRTNAGLPSLTGDWYFGVLNPGTANLGYSVMARQPVNGVLLSSTPIQMVRPPGAPSLASGSNFGFDLDVVPGEKYQVQYRTNLASGTWLVLTNLVAPTDGLINFLHSGALSNRNLYYRVQVVP